MITSLCQIEIQVSDLARSAKFYAEVFGWRVVPAFMHDYMVLEGAPGQNYGLSMVASRNPAVRRSAGLTLYFRCDDPAATAAKAEALGGKVLLADKRLPSYGFITVIADPDGHKFGLFKVQAASPAGPLASPPAL